MARKKKKQVTFVSNDLYKRIPAPNVKGYMVGFQFINGKFQTDDDFIIEYISKFADIVLLDNE